MRSTSEEAGSVVLVQAKDAAVKALDAATRQSAQHAVTSMKWVNPPVAFMLHAGVPLLLDAGVHLPGHHPGDASRVALEAYPGLLARELIVGVRPRPS